VLVSLSIDLMIGDFVRNVPSWRPMFHWFYITTYN